jgi:transposase-like protein
MNAKEPEIIDRFIELRAQGCTVARIATELNVCKNTLLKWGRRHHHRIQNLRALETEALSEQCRLSPRICLENLGEDSRRIRDELARRNLEDVPTSRLFFLAALVRREARRLNGPLRISESVTDLGPEADLFTQPTITWEI